MISLLTSEVLQTQSAKFKLLPQNMSWPGTAFGITITAHTLTVVCHFGHFVKKKLNRETFYSAQQLCPAVYVDQA